MLKKIFSLLLIISIVTLNFDTHNHIHDHDHDHDHEHGSHHAVIIECEDCQFINETKNNFIDVEKVFSQKIEFNFITLSLIDILVSSDLESQKKSRAPPSIS